MKFKSLLSCALLSLAVSAWGANEEAANDVQSTGGMYPYEKNGVSNASPALKESHWALYIPMGMTFADMDERDGAKLGSGISDLTANLGLGVEYDFTPVWGFNFEFMAANYGKHSFKATKQADGTRADGTSFGNAYNLRALISFDLMDAFFPKRKQTIFNLYGLGGGGLGFFTFTPEKDTRGEGYVDNKPYSYKTKGKNFGYAPFFTFGLMADFNLTRTFSLGIRGMYDYYMTDLMDGPSRYATGYKNIAMADGKSYLISTSDPQANRNNDGLFTADLVFRFKLNAKDRSHVANYSSPMYASAVAVQEAREAQAEEQRKAVKDTLVISHKDTLVVMNEQQPAQVSAMDDYYFVYFATDKYALDDQALVDIQKVAFRMEQDTSICLELSGFTDNTGSSKRNEFLAKKRSEAVRDQLVNVYGIDESRLLPMGKGSLTNVKSAFAPNRRVNMHVVSKEQLEQTKKELEEQEAAKKAELEQKQEKKADAVAEPEQEKSEEERLSELTIDYDKTQYLGVEVVDKKTTLSKLARKYYDNTHCWVYIYRTNKDVIKSPSYLWPGTKLYMPILTDEEKQITKEEALELMQTVK